MTIQEMSDMFDVYYNNITSNQAPGLNEYEKSVFLTKAEREIVKNYFTANSAGNTLNQGFDDSAKRQADFSILMNTAICTPASISDGYTSSISIQKFTCYTSTPTPKTLILYSPYISLWNGTTPYTAEAYTSPKTVTYSSGTATVTIDGTKTIENWPFQSGGTLVIQDVTMTNIAGRIDPRSVIYNYPSNAFIIINESLTLDNNPQKQLQVIPLRYDEYTRLMSKPFKYPVKNQAWRLINSGTVSGGAGVRQVEIITNTWDKGHISQYSIRYIRTPKPIILADISPLTIDNVSTASLECELDPILHEDILQRAVELAKVAWTATGQDNLQAVMESGKRSE